MYDVRILGDVEVTRYQRKWLLTVNLYFYIRDTSNDDPVVTIGTYDQTIPTVLFRNVWLPNFCFYIKECENSFILIPIYRL